MSAPQFIIANGADNVNGTERLFQEVLRGRLTISRKYFDQGLPPTLEGS
jgi:hypothetical protein